MGARRGAGHGPTKRDERDPGIAQERLQRRTFGAVGVHGHIESLMVIEAQAIVHGSLTVRAHRERSAEALTEEAIETWGVGQRPRGGSTKSYEDGSSHAGLG